MDDDVFSRERERIERGARLPDHGDSWGRGNDPSPGYDLNRAVVVDGRVVVEWRAAAMERGVCECDMEHFRRGWWQASESKPRPRSERNLYDYLGWRPATIAEVQGYDSYISIRGPLWWRRLQEEGL